MRDDFPNKVKETLAKRVGLRCSNPDCRQLTSGPNTDESKATNIGVAAHITAASPGGPRYDDSLGSEERTSSKNGIWLDQKCGKLIDSDPDFYTVPLLYMWKSVAEKSAQVELQGSARQTDGHAEMFGRLEHQMPSLLDEMREDLKKEPLGREFVVLKRSWGYWGKGHELSYFYDDHDQLDRKVRILENQGLIQDITHNDVKRYVTTEELAGYLTTPRVSADED